MLEQPKDLILASASASRAQLLTAAGLRFTIAPSAIDEAALKARHQGTPQELALALAQAKAEAVYEKQPASDVLFLAADQLLVCEDKIFDKPRSRADARAYLQFLRGKTHQLVGGLVLLENSAIIWQHTQIAQLTMRDFSDAFLDTYLQISGDAILSSVGAYQLEALGVQLFAHIEGDYSGILGLPILPVLRALRAYGGLAA